MLKITKRKYTYNHIYINRYINSQIHLKTFKLFDKYTNMPKIHFKNTFTLEYFDDHS